MLSIKKLYIVALLFFLLPFYPAAQQKTVSFEQVILDKDIRDDYYLSIFQDRDGYLWLGTHATLYRYNGYSVKTFISTESTNSLSNPSVHAIFQDSSGIIWFGTEGGLNRYDPKTEKINRVLLDSAGIGLTHPHIKSICQDKQGILWIGTYGGGINLYNPATGLFSSYTHTVGNSNSLSSNRVNVVYADSSGDIWVGTELGGLCRYNRHTDNFDRLLPEKGNPHAISDDIITAIYEDQQGYLWIATWRGGLNRFNPRTRQFEAFLTQERKPGSSEVLTIRSLAADGEGNLWLGTLGNGLYRFDTKDFSHTSYTARANEEEALNSNFIWSLYTDRTGILWIGTAGSGLNKYDKNRRKFPSYPVAKADRFPVKALFEDSKGNLWISSDNGVLAKFNRETKAYQYFLDKNISFPITAITEDGWGNLWLGGHHGLIRFDPAENNYSIFTKFFNGQETSMMITALYHDKQGNLWVALYDRGVYKIEASLLNKPALKSSWFVEYRHNPSYSNSLSSNIVWDIKEDEAGNMWFATDKSLVRYNSAQNTFQHFGAYNFSCLYLESPNVVWAGTYGRGLARLNLKDVKLEFLDESAGLSNKLVNAITGDRKGNIWISSIKGISKYNPAERKFQNFDVSDGLQGNMFMHNSVARLASGALVFGGTKGFNLFDPELIINTPPSTPVVISDIKLFNKSLSLDTVKHRKALGGLAVDKAPQLELSYKDNMFSIEFAALNFSTPEKTGFLYKLQGFDQEWVYTDANNRIATYTNLDGGEYNFVVKALDASGNIGTAEASLSIVVNPPIYKTWYFRLFLVLMTMSGALFVYRKRMQLMEARYQKMQLETEQELIRIKNEKLDAELTYKSTELTSRTMNLIHKNEKIQEIKNAVLNALPKAQGPVVADLKMLLRSIEKEARNESHWDQFEFHFNETHDNFLKRFKEAYPVLTVNDLKVCAYIRMNLSNNEIASILNISIRAVETSRYRIRKKIMLNNQSISLTEYILKF